MSEKSDANPMRSAHLAPRCTARSKRTGLPCRGPAVRGWTVCRMHGARGGAPTGTGNGSWRHGGRSLETIERRREITELIRLSRAMMEEL